MAPLLDDGAGVGNETNDSTNGHNDSHKPRFLIIGAGSRGNSYARAVADAGLGTIVAVADPIEFKRKRLGFRYIWGEAQPSPNQEFAGYAQYVRYEIQRRKDEAAGHDVSPGIDGVFVCVLDEQHVEVVEALGPLGLHIMCEKPLATTLKDCLKMQRSIQASPESTFAIGHVLRYSPHNMLLRHLVLEQGVIGEILSIEHTEPVGWWHFSHSYVRGNWRKEKTTAPSLLTKSCHDIDFLLWMLCSPAPGSRQSPHMPCRITSTGSLKQFQRRHKPSEAGDATNCLSCPIRDSCMYSSPRIYYDRHLAKGNAKWPVHIVNPEVEALHAQGETEKAKEALFDSLAEDYTVGKTPARDIESRPWYGRCVWESDNDVVDDQYVTFEWEDDPLPDGRIKGRGAKSANFHMIAQSLAQCERRGRIYGTAGEISYDSKSITVYDFTDGETRKYNPEVPKNSHHGGGDDGLAKQFVEAVAAVQTRRMSVEDAQLAFMGCTLEEVVRSHAAVFAAEEARLHKKVVVWKDWWRANVLSQLGNS